MLKQPLIAALLATTIAVGSAHAAVTPRSGGADARVKHVIYHEQDVTVIKGHYGYSTAIEFGKDEAIKNVAMGDSVAWQVTPANQNLLFIKPLEENASTNMTVVTTKRIYSFDLSAAKASGRKNDLTYRMRFVYPDEEAAALANIGEGYMAGSKLVSGDTTPADWNFDYNYSGSKNLRPKQAFDDGKFTYFHFAKNGRSPAIFVVDDHGNESLVNYHKQGDYIVVERLGRRFTLRDGEDVTCIFNENFPVAKFDDAPLAPRSTTAVEPVAISEASDVMVIEQKPAPEPKPQTRASSGWLQDASETKKQNEQRNSVKR